MMLPIRCPQCGTVNHPDDIGFPHCGQCHEDLVRCSSCRHHEAIGCRHPRATARYSVNLEAAKSCPLFSSVAEVRGPRLFWHVPAPVWVSMFLLIIMLGLASIAVFIDPAGRFFNNHALRLETIIVGPLRVGQPAAVTLRVTNLLHWPSAPVYLEISDKFLTETTTGNPVPTPVHVSRDQNRLILAYDPLPPEGQFVVQLPFTPRESGQINFEAKAYAPSHLFQQEVTSSIIVQAGPGLAMHNMEGRVP